MDVRGAVERDGFAIVRAESAEASASPHAFAEALLGAPVLFVERQPIRPVPGGRSFASTRADTPLHTDSQMLLGVPPAVQILLCVCPARSGGQSVLVDGSRLAARLDAEDRAFADALFAVDRAQRFYFGEVRGPTVALRGGHLAWTVAPMANDPVGARLAAELSREAPIVHALRAGEALVASNHRMLHGRRAFEGERDLLRLLVWLERPLAADRGQVARARVVAPPLAPAVLAKVRAVFALLRAVPPARVAREAQIDEETLYAWRDAFVRHGIAGLRDPSGEGGDRSN